jgi:hypothetical protein
MKQQRSVIRVAAAVLAAAAAPGAHAVDLEAGDWKFSVTGNVNGSFIYSSCDSSAHSVVGGLACIAPTGSSSVSNGLLPAAIAFNGSTNQSGYDLAFTFGFYPGLSANDGGSPNLQATDPYPNTALATTGLDIRQVFLTFGNDIMGTVMVGRNIGLFGGDAILNDMTLIAVGAGNGNYAAPVNTSLGSIGLGYIYTDWLAQIDYTTPEFSGFKATVGTFDPLETLGSFQNTSATKGIPGFQGKIAYTFSEQLYLSASGLFQKQRGIAVPDANLQEGRGYSSWAFDVGGRVDMGPFQVLGWYYMGTGVGTTGLFNLANSITGKPRNSNGFLAQITWQLGTTKLGFNYGQSRLQRADNESTSSPITVPAVTVPVTLPLPASLLVAKNSKYTFGIYQSLTDNLTLTAEASYLESDNHNNQRNSSRNFDVGAFLKF